MGSTQPSQGLWARRHGVRGSCAWEAPDCSRQPPLASDIGSLTGASEARYGFLAEALVPANEVCFPLGVGRVEMPRSELPEIGA